MNRSMTMLSAAAVLLSGPAIALQNADFADYELPADGSSVSYAPGEGPPSWTIVVNAGTGGGVYTSAALASQGSSYFAFNPPLTDGFGANKLEQCVPVTDSESLSISYAVFAATATGDARTFAVRVNPTFWPDFASCRTATATDSGTGRLSGGRENDDNDFALGEDQGGVWIERGPAQQPGLFYAQSDIPVGAAYMRLSIRARARDGVAGLDPQPQLRLDNIRVTQGGSLANRVVNGSFEHGERFDGQFLTGMSGWQVGRGGDTNARAAVGPVSFAQSGSNVFYFEDVTGNFGVSSLDQCVVLNGEDIRPSISAYTLRPDAELAVRLNVDFYPDASCSGTSDGALRIREDFTLDGAAGQWVALITEEVRSAAQYGDAGSALLNVRVRDRSADGSDAPGEFARTVYLDDAAIVSAIATPVFSPAPGEYTSSVVVTITSATPGAILYYTDDGSTPDDTSATLANGGQLTITETTTLNVVAFEDGQFSAVRSGTFAIVTAAPPPSGPLNRSTGCSVSAQPSVMDPTLWLLLLIATAGLAWRRRARKAD